MSLENAIEENTKALRGIAASLAVIVAKGYAPTAVAEAEKEVAKAEPKAEKPKTEAKAEKPKAEVKAEKPVAEKSDKDLMQEVLDEADAENEDDDLLGTCEDVASEDDVPALPAGKRDLEFAKNYLVTPIFSKMHRDELKKILDEFGAARITEIPSEKWDDLYAAGYKLLKSAGKI